MAARRARVLRDQQTDGHPQALRRHLIRVTQRLLAAHGLTGLTTRSIAREAEVSDGVLYNHFADKDDLVVAAIAERLTELGSRFAATAPRPGEQDLRTGLDALVRLCLQFQGDAMPLIGGLLGRPDLVQELFDRLHTLEGAPHLLWSEICAFLEAEQALGTVSPDVDPHTVAAVIFGSCQLDILIRVLAGRSVLDPGAPLHEGAAADPERLVRFLLRACAEREEPAGG